MGPLGRRVPSLGHTVTLARVGMSYGPSEPWSPLRHCGFTRCWLYLRVVTLHWLGPLSPLPSPACSPALPVFPQLPSALQLRSCPTLVLSPHRPGIPRLPVVPHHQDPLGLPLPRPSQCPAISCQSLVPSGLPSLRPGHLLMSLIPRGGWVSVGLLGGQTGQATVGIRAFAQQRPFSLPFCD